MWNAVCEANAVAFDEVAAEELEEEARRVSELVRTLHGKVKKDPGNAALRGIYAKKLEELHAKRAYFMPPRSKDTKDKYTRRPWNVKRVGPPPPRQWRLEDSIFSQRAKECDARAFYDDSRVLQRQLDMDWARVVAKTRFLKLVKKADAGVADGGESLKSEMTEIYEAVLGRYAVIRSTFYYYCARGSGIGEVSFSMLANQWGTFCREVGIADQSSAYCCNGALDAMFIATNFEEGEAMSMEEQDENDDNALMRFEWIEILIRAAIAKFIKCKRATADVSEAVIMLCDEHMSRLPPGAETDSNQFRRDRLYNEAVDVILRAHHPMLKALYKVYKAKDSAKWFQLEHWMAFLDSLQLVGTRSGIGTTQAKLLFMWSQTGNVDELRRRQRVVSWTFIDFLEGLGRLAEALSLPPEAQLEALRASDANSQTGSRFEHEGKFAYWDFYKLRAHSSQRRPSAGVIRGSANSPTRPLAEKMDALIHLLVAGLCEAWNIPKLDEKKLTEKLYSMATFMSGGIEIGH